MDLAPGRTLCPAGSVHMLSPLTNAKKRKQLEASELMRLNAFQNSKSSTEQSRRTARTLCSRCLLFPRSEGLSPHFQERRSGRS